MTSSPLHCRNCGSIGNPSAIYHLPKEKMPPGLRFRVQKEGVQIRPELVICNTCFRVLCKLCSGGVFRRCPYCQEDSSLLLPGFPATPPPSWWRLKRRWRWWRAKMFLPLMPQWKDSN
jgi:hypothetical protein